MRQNHEVGVTAGGLDGDDGALEIFAPGAGMDVGRAARLLEAGVRIDLVAFGDANRRDAGLAFSGGRAGAQR